MFAIIACFVTILISPILLFWWIYFLTLERSFDMPLKAKLSAKPNATKADFKTAGCTDDECNQIEAFIQKNGINWATLWQLVVQYGPQIVQFILAIAGGGTPVVTP